MARFVKQASPLKAGAAAACVLLGMAALATVALAADDNAVLKVPRFVSLHSDKVNLRTGPGRQYPIEWVLTRKNMPVEVTAQFEHWRRVREWDGTEGWVQEHMVDSKRFVVVDRSDREGNNPLRAGPDPVAAVVARAEPGVIARLLGCQGDWCRVEAAGTSGWMKRNEIWGVYPDETPQ